MSTAISVRPLSAEEFKPYGDVIAFPSAPEDPAKAKRMGGIARLDFQGGTPSLDLLYSPIRSLQIETFERHRNSTQAFLPLAPVPFVVVVAPAAAGDETGVDPTQLVAFVSDGRTGVSFHAGIWHHPLLPIGAPLVSAIIHRNPEIDLDGQLAKLRGGPVSLTF